MKQDPAIDRLRRASRRELERQQALEEAIARRAGRELQAGDLLAFDLGLDVPVEWLLVSRGPADTWLLAPADSEPFLGSGDAAVTKSISGATLSARCRHRFSIRQASFEAAERCGWIEPPQLESVRTLCQQLAASTVTPSGMDSRADYEDWIDEMVEPACESLQRNEQVTRRQAEKPASARIAISIGYRWAAVVLLTAGLATAVTWLSVRTQVASSQRAFAGVPSVLLSVTAVQRGEPTFLEVPEGAERAVVLLFLDPLETYPHYLVDMVAESDGRAVLAKRVVVDDGSHRITLDLPRALIPAGQYRIDLRGAADGQHELIASLELTVRVR